jgi:DNA-binding response OmpR family regulator
VLTESDPATATALIDAAAQIGIDTTWCRDGAEALLAVGAGLPAVLVIGAHTDTVDAPRITAAVRSHDSDLPILVGAGPGEEEPTVFTAGPIHVDRRGYETRVRGRDVQLTQRELELLVFLIEQRGKVASREEISRAVWGRSSHTNTVAVHVKRLREKLGNDAEHGEFIRTIRGAGYRLAPSVCA